MMMSLALRDLRSKPKECLCDVDIYISRKKINKNELLLKCHDLAHGFKFSFKTLYMINYLDNDEDGVYSFLYKYITPNILSTTDILLLSVQVCGFCLQIQMCHFLHSGIVSD